MERESMLAVCRLAYMLIDELVENEEQREKNLKTVEKVVNELNDKRTQNSNTSKRIRTAH